jgi:hypothetical protein
VNVQLTLDVAHPPHDLDDLDFAGHEERLDQLGGVDFQPPPPPASCECERHGLPVRDEFGDLTCWLCGRPA